MCPALLSLPRAPSPDGAVPARKTQNPRATIALLLDYMSFLSDLYQTQVLEAFHAKAEELDLNLLLVFGRAIDEPNAYSRMHNAIFNIVGPESADGVVVLTTVLAAHCGQAGVSRLIHHYDRMAICSLSAALPGVPAVVIDDGPAMEAVVEHVVAVHGCRRVAFIAGTRESPEALARLEAYQRVLMRHAIEVDPSLIGYGDFVHSKGYSAMSEILERAGPVEAVVAANDTMALGAIEALRKRGYVVPRDVLITGFDDVMMARMVDPSLTTVAQPFEAMAEASLLNVLGQIEGRAVPELTTVAAEFIVRRSCGCGAKDTATQLPVAVRSTPERLVEHWASTLRPRLSMLLRNGRSSYDSDARRLLDALRLELAAGQAGCGAFQQVIEELLDESRGDGESFRALHDAVNLLRNEFRATDHHGLADIWYCALSSIAYRSSTVQVHNQLQLNQNYLALLSVADRVSVAMDLPALERAVANSAPQIGIPTALFSRFVESSSRLLEPFACVIDGSIAELSRAAFAAEHLVPPSAAHLWQRRHTWAVFPLVFETQWLGVAVFEYSRRTNGYQLMREQIAAALGNITLHEQVFAKSMLHERSLQERQATARRLQALSVLAGGVAHDLNNTLGPLLALPDVILRELGEYSRNERPIGALEDVYADMASIKSAGMRAAQTIKDLLTLGRQGQAAKDPADLNRIVRVAVADAPQLAKAGHQTAIVALDLNAHPLVVRASEAHLARAVGNLVRNAAEAMPGGGQVVVKTFGARLTEAQTGYETIEPGEYAVVSVEDTGSGVDSDSLDRIFEPFFSKKRLGDQSGSGLGLAIVHSVVKEHAGFVDVSSVRGKGTTFTLYFPIAHDPMRAESRRPSARGGTGRILVVDDDPIQGRTARRVLTHLGYEVTVLESGRQALDLFEQTCRSEDLRHALVILDRMLKEDQDGLELLAELRRLDPQQPVIIASGQAPDERAEEEILNGLIWLAKPYTTEALAAAVQAALPQSEISAVSGL